MDRQTFLIYLLQLPFFGLLARYTGLVQPQKHYLLNTFAIAGFQFHNGAELITNMNVGSNLSLTQEPTNPHDEHAVLIKYRNESIGYVPRSDNKHIFRLLVQGMNLVCEITELNPEVDPWQMVKVKVELST